MPGDIAINNDKCIIHIITSLQRGGRERQLSIIGRYSNFNNLILYYNKANSDYISEYELESKTIRISDTGFVSRLFKTFQVCKRNQAKCIVSWGILETIIGMFVSKALNIPLINFSIRHGIRRRKFSHLFRSLLLQMSRYVVANSIAGLKANNLRSGFVIYNGIENIPQPKTHEQKQIMQKARLGVTDQLVLVSVANLVPYKDYKTVLYALNNLKKQNLKFFYIIIGAGPNRADIESTIELLGLKEDTLLTGSISNVDYYLEMSDILIHSSLGEGCSNAILEGMKHGLPIIATRVGGTPEIVEHSNAILFEFGDIDGFSKKLVLLMNNSEMMTSMGKSSHDIVIKRFTVTQMIQNYENIIKAIVTRDIHFMNKLIIKTR